MKKKFTQLKKKLKKLKKKLNIRLVVPSWAVSTVLILSVLPFITIFSLMFGPKLHHKFLQNSVGNVVVKALKDDLGRSGGTGFYVTAPSGKSYILTNAHVCGDSLNEIVFVQHLTSNHPKRLVPRRIIDISEKYDLCLVQGYGDISGISIADSVDKGELSWVVGHPRLYDLTVSFGMLIHMDYPITLVKGVNLPKNKCNKPYLKLINVPENSVEAIFFNIKTVCIRFHRGYQSNAVIHPGNSGSPVVNMFGNLIAVAFAGDKQGFSYFVKLEDIKDFLKVY